jgi:hypothetical protein
MTSPTYQQRAYRNDDHAAILDKVHRAQLRVADLERSCAADEAQIRAAQTRFDALPAYDRGWMLELIAVLAMLAIVLEWFPARMMSLVFFFASAVELQALTAAFAFGGFLLGLVLGELARRHRQPQRHAALDTVCFALAAIAVIAFLAVGFELRYGYAQASTDGAVAAIGPVVQAAALTTLAFIGIVIAFTSGYHRESFDSLRLRWRLSRLRGELRTNEAHLAATQHELAAAERAATVAVDGYAPVAAAAPAAAAAANGAVAADPTVPTVSGNGVYH